MAKRKTKTRIPTPKAKKDEDEKPTTRQREDENTDDEGNKDEDENTDDEGKKDEDENTDDEGKKDEDENTDDEGKKDEDENTDDEGEKQSEDENTDAEGEKNEDGNADADSDKDEDENTDVDGVKDEDDGNDEDETLNADENGTSDEDESASKAEADEVPTDEEENNAQGGEDLLTGVEPGDAEPTEEEQTEEKAEEAAPATRRIYHYEDGNIHAVVSLSEASAIPDDAELVVTPIRSGSGHDSYMDALNNASSESYDDSNTLLYDFAFLVDEKDEEGNPTGKKIEVQPAEGSMGVAVTFKRNQITNIVPEEATSSDVEVSHLPLGEGALSTADKTLDASFSAGDVDVKTVPANINLEGNTDSVTFSVGGFSTFAFHIVSGETVTEETNETGILEKEDGRGNKVILDLSGAGLPEGHYDVSLSWATATPEQRATLEAALTEDVSAEMGEGIRKVAHLPEDIQLIDIKIINTDTNESIEPNAGVRVTIEQNGKVLPAVIHLIDDNQAETLPASENTFETESFSLFYLGGYTVDYTYEGFTYRFPGQDTYTVEAILDALNIHYEGSIDYEKTSVKLIVVPDCDMKLIGGIGLFFCECSTGNHGGKSKGTGHYDSHKILFCSLHTSQIHFTLNAVVFNTFVMKPS